LQIRLYGRLADAIGRQVELDAPEGCSIGDVRQQLGSDHPDAAAVLAASRAFVGDVVVEDSRPTALGETIEFLPLVSGG
jgi:molybdopterin converting factor small subunit